MQAMILVVLVEDEAAILDMVKEALEDGGFEVADAKDGSDALSILTEKQADLRGLITDINIGSGPNGWEVAMHAREMRPDLPVVYMSGGNAHEWSAHGVPNSILITKPFATAQIVTAIAGLINLGSVPH